MLAAYGALCLAGWPYFWEVAIMGKNSELHGGKCPGLDPAASVLGSGGSWKRGWLADHSFIIQ